MLNEYSPFLAKQCEAAVQELYDAIINNMQAHFQGRQVPETLNPLSGAALLENPLYLESCDLIADAVANLTAAERFAIRCHSIEIGAGDPDDAAISTQLMDLWLAFLSDQK